MEFYGLSYYKIFSIILILVTTVMIILMMMRIIGVKILATSARNLLILSILHGMVVVIIIKEKNEIPFSSIMLWVFMILGFAYRVNEKRHITANSKNAEIFKEEEDWKAKHLRTDKK